MKNQEPKPENAVTVPAEPKSNQDKILPDLQTLNEAAATQPFATDHISMFIPMD